MKLEKYLEYRDIFENRFLPTDLGYCVLDNMLKNIYNKKLFINIYAFDKRCYFHVTVASIDKNKRYKILKNNTIGSKIKLDNNSTSIIDKYGNIEFEKIIKYLKDKL